MATTVTQVQQDLITGLKAKLQFVENKLSDLQTAKGVEVETENTRHTNEIVTIDTNYASQISDLKNEITDLQSQINEVK